MKSIPLLLILLWAMPAHGAADGTARWYACSQSDPVFCKYYLLAKPPVQRRLNLSQARLDALKAAIRSPMVAVPGVAEIRQSKTNRLAKARSEEERNRIRQAANEQVLALNRQHLLSVLATSLTAAQSNLLEQLFLQMKGPPVIWEDARLQAKLRLSPEQTNCFGRVLLKCCTSPF